MTTIPPPSTDAATMLVVTPDPVLRAWVCAMLHFSGYRSLAPAAPRDAVELVEEFGVRGVFFDLGFSGFTPSLLLSPAAAEGGADVSSEWLKRREDLTGSMHIVLTGQRRATPQQIAEAAAVGKSVTFVGQPFGLHPFRTALQHFSADNVPSPARPAGATGTMLALPARDDLPATEGFRDPRAPGTEHRRDRRFPWSCSAVILGREEERAEICEVSRTGLRIRKSGRELTPGTHLEVSFVADLNSPRGREIVGIRALGQVVWSAEGMTQIEAGLTLHAVQPLPDFISVLVSLFAESR